MEWVALERALRANGEEFRDDIKDALVFRSVRRSLFPGSADNENLFELHEGLPEYTGVKLSSKNMEDFKAHIINDVRALYVESTSYVRMFGYYSGLLYGCLLDMTGIEWRKELTINDDLGKKLQDALHIRLSPEINTMADLAKSRYDYENIFLEESKIKQHKDSILDSYRREFLIRQVVMLDLVKPRFGFNPGNLQPLDFLGTIYPDIVINDEWGTLTVNRGGCLILTDWQHALVSADDIISGTDEITGTGWMLRLNKGYHLERTKRGYHLVRS